MNDLFLEIKNSVVTGKHEEIEALVKKAVLKNENLNNLINNALIGAMEEVGQQFSNSEIFVPEMLVAAITMKKGLEIIKPLLCENDYHVKGRVILCTVKGDLHDIGKNLVVMMLEGSGFEVIDLGIDCSVESVISKIKEFKPDVLGLSALLTTTMPEMGNIVKELKTQGIRGQVKIIIGGAPISADFAKKIGADAYGKDAASAVSIVKKLINS